MGGICRMRSRLKVDNKSWDGRKTEACNELKKFIVGWWEGYICNNFARIQVVFEG